jgi:hypothetical protein
MPVFTFLSLLLRLQIGKVERRIPYLTYHRPETEEEDNESFLRRYSICEEERLVRTGEMRTGLNGPRWFRSANIVCLEKVRAMRAGNRAEAAG